MKFFKHSLIAFLCASSLSVMAESVAYTPVVSEMDMTRSTAGAGTLNVSYTIDRTLWKLPSNTEVELTPVVVFGKDSVELTPVILAGRNAYLAHKRNDDLPKTTDLVQAKGDPLQRSVSLPWQPGMMQSELIFRTETRGCRCKNEGAGILDRTLAMDFTPRHFDLIIPRDQLAALEENVADVVKTREITKSAYVNYKLSSTVLLPDYKQNSAELATILATIDSVRDDKDHTVRSVFIHGFASPEGPYSLNKRLAAGRTEALRRYVDAHYGFGSKLTTESTPEDWEGLRKWVEASGLTNTKGILKVIDSNMDPDAKDEALKTRYPNSYKLIINKVYPSLRRTDYTINYTVRTFNDVATIRQMLQSNPEKLSMEEIMLLARTYQPGSEERNYLALKAADLFPEDWRAQLTGAFVALSRNDLPQASSMLSRSGDSPLADYARGVLAIYQNDKAKAEPLLKRAAAAKIEGASEALDFLKEM